MKFEVVKLDENLVSIKLFKDENVDKAEYVARFIFNDLKGSIITVRKQTTKYVQLLFKGNVKDSHELMYAICPTTDEDGRRVTLSKMDTKQAAELFERFRTIIAPLGVCIPDPDLRR